MKIFQEAYKLMQNDQIKHDFTNRHDLFYKVKTYTFRIYQKGCSWFSQCGCHVGVSNTPSGLCKHFIAVIVEKFLESNNLKLVEKDED